MKSYQIFLAVIFIFLSVNELNAQKEWTLEECIDYAIENNITVKRQELSAQAAEKNYLQSKMELLPNLNASGNHYYNSGKAINYDTYTYENQDFQGGSLSLTSEAEIFNGLANINTIKKNKYTFLSQLQNTEEVKNDITLNITTAYLQILLNKELYDNAKKQLEVTLEQVDKTKRLVEIGNAAKGDLLQIQAQAAAEKADLINKENNLKIAYLDLTQLLNLESADNFQIEFPEIPDITVEENNNVADVYSKAIDFLPEIKSAEYQVESSKKDLKISYGQLSPKIYIGYQYQSRYNELSQNINDPTNNYPYMDQINDNASQAIYVAARIPIFNRWQTKTTIDKAKINLYDSRLNLDLQKQNVYKTIQQAYTQAIAAKEKYKANLESAQSMAEAFRYTEQKYQVGLVDIIEYKSVKNDFNVAESNVAQAKYEYIFRKKILEFYKGEQIVL
ncbi:MAG: TolC family protein [Bacteroidales bacterium]